MVWLRGSMIQTSLTNLIIFNLCGLLVLLGLMWVWRMMRDRQRDYRRRRHQVVCGLCGHLFSDTSREMALRCPGCEKLVPRQEVLEL